MIVYVDMEHDRMRARPRMWERTLAVRLRDKFRLEEISGEPCLIVRYKQVTPAMLDELGVRAVVVSGCYSDFEHYSEESLAGLAAIYQDAGRPMLGICAGHQMMAEYSGASIGPIGPLPPGAEDAHAGSLGHVPGALQERGYMAVNLGDPHPLFAGLGRRPTFFQSHYWEVKERPAGFEVLADSELCAIQAIAHKERPLYGVQFHPEEYDRAHQDGRKVLENFFRLTGIIR
jgi:GMP synthase (glutamine-hydrolysing)